MEAGHSLDTRERILASARRLFATGLEADTSLAQVAREAGVSRATLHRHFGSRQDLLEAVAVQPEPGARDRVLGCAIELLARDGLARLSMDELAALARMSRANLYRLFAGKAALFRELIRVYSPMEPIGAVVTELRDQPPDVVMPEVARTAARHFEGRVGLLRSLIFEVSGPTSEAEAARELVAGNWLIPMAAYLVSQMRAGKLRQMHPLLAMQSFAGPIVFHLLLRPYAETLFGFEQPLEDSVAQLAQVWLAGMRPEGPQ